MNEKPMNENPWLKNANNMIFVYSIFAAISGVLLVFVLQDKCFKFNNLWKWPVSLFTSSLFLFSLTAERTSEAVNESNIRRRIAYMLICNLGVILLFFGGALTIYYKYNCYNLALPIISTVLAYIPSLKHIWWLIMIPSFLAYIYVHRWEISWAKPWACLLIILLAFLSSIPCPEQAWWLPAVLLSIPWVDDAIWLIFSKDKEFKEYFRIPGNITRYYDERLPAWIFYFLRYIVNLFLGEMKKTSLPHDDVYTRLQCSPIHGVGVFAIRDIPKGTKIFKNDDGKMIRVSKADISNGKIDLELKRLYDDFCVLKNGKLYCPKNFNMLTVGWYINESKDNPNVRCNDDYDFIALRDIKRGEELTVNYSTYGEHPKGLL